MTKELPSPETLRKLLRYDPETGKLFWRQIGMEFFKNKRLKNSWNNRFCGKEAMTFLNGKGQKKGSLLSITMSAHRVIWAMQTGAWPENQIDHIDRNPSNNRFENLRLATAGQNMANTSSRKGSTSKYLGVSWCKKNQKWRSRICKNGVYSYLGNYKCEVKAAKAYDQAAKEIHGKFANLNFS